MIEEAGGRAIVIPADVTDQQAVERAVATVAQQLGPVDLLVNSAGVPGPWTSTWEADPDEWWSTLNVNVRGPYLFAREVLRGMIPSRGGRIINISSVPGGGLPYVGAYAAPKAALTALTYCLAGETKSFGISVFAYFPGFVRTAMTEWSMTSANVHESRRERMQGVFDRGQDDPIEQSTQQFMILASGRLDALSGCYIHVQDDMDDLLRRAEEIQRDKLYMQRRVTSSDVPRSTLYDSGSESEPEAVARSGAARRSPSPR